MTSFREKYNIDKDAKPDKRKCVYCGSKFSTITGRLCCKTCAKRTPQECDAIFDRRWRECGWSKMLK